MQVAEGVRQEVSLCLQMCIMKYTKFIHLIRLIKSCTLTYILVSEGRQGKILIATLNVFGLANPGMYSLPVFFLHTYIHRYNHYTT